MPRGRWCASPTVCANTMSPLDILAVLLTLAVAIYLFVALLKPEKFE